MNFYVKLLGQPMQFKAIHLAIIGALHLLAELFLFSDEFRWAASADPGSWTAQAYALLEHGNFLKDGASGEYNTWRPPLIPLLFAFTLKVNFLPSEFGLLIATQILMIIVSAIFVAKTVNLYLPRFTLLSFYLFSLNPIIFITPHLIIAESLYLLFISAGCMYLTSFTKTFSRKDFFKVSFLLALSCLTRPTPMFLILILPLTPLLLSLLSRRNLKNKRSICSSSLKIGTAGLMISLLTLSPWLLYMNSVGHGIALSHPSVFSRHIWDQVITVHSQAHNLSHDMSARELELEPEGVVQTYLKNLENTVQDLSLEEKSRNLARLGMSQLAEYPVHTLAASFFRSMVRFNVTGGSSEYKTLMNIPTPRTAQDIYGHSNQGSPQTFLQTYWRGLHGASLWISVVCIGFAILTRIVELIGLVFCLRNKEHRPQAAVLGAIFIYFMFIMLFLGSARYRVPAEPALTVLFCWGTVALKQLLSTLPHGRRASTPDK